MRTYAGEKTYKCQLCEKLFSHRHHLKEHMRIHTGEKPYKCQLCQKSFTTGSHLRGHLRTHTGDKPWKCQLCQKSFTAGSSLRTHMRIHTGEKPHSCQICQKSFTKIFNLKVHLRIHNGEKPYMCQFCQKSFAHSSGLKTHVRTHTGEKPYICEVCNKGFTLIGDLKNHRRTHATEKEYAHNKPCTKRKASAKHCKVKEEAKTNGLQMESEVIDSRSDNFNTCGRTYAIDKPIEVFSNSVYEDSVGFPRLLAEIRDDHCLHISKVKLLVDRKAFLLKSFGCGICDKLLETKKEFLEHCSSHRLSPPDDLAAHLC